MNILLEYNLWCIGSYDKLFALNHDKNIAIIVVLSKKRRAQNNNKETTTTTTTTTTTKFFLKDVQSRVVEFRSSPPYLYHMEYIQFT